MVYRILDELAQVANFERDHLSRQGQYALFYRLPVYHCPLTFCFAIDLSASSSRQGFFLRSRAVPVQRAKGINLE